MKIAISSDHGGNNLRQEIIQLLSELGWNLKILDRLQMILSIILTLLHLLRMGWRRVNTTEAF